MKHLPTIVIVNDNVAVRPAPSLAVYSTGYTPIFNCLGGVKSVGDTVTVGSIPELSVAVGTVHDTTVYDLPSSEF